MPIDPRGRPSYETASQVTKTLTTIPTQGPATRPAAHTDTIRSLSQPLCESLNSSINPRIRNTHNAVPRSRTESRQRSRNLTPGTKVNTNAAVTNTQRVLKILFIAGTPVSVIKKSSVPASLRWTVARACLCGSDVVEKPYLPSPFAAA